MGMVTLPLGEFEKKVSVTFGFAITSLDCTVDEPQTKGRKPGPVVRVYWTCCGIWKSLETKTCTLLAWSRVLMKNRMERLAINRPTKQPKIEESAGER